MDINLMVSILPSLLNGAIITLKLLVSSMFFGLLIGLLFAILRINKNLFIIGFLFILKIAKSKPISNPKNIEDTRSFKVMTAPFNRLGKILIIKFISIKNLCCI